MWPTSIDSFVSREMPEIKTVMLEDGILSSISKPRTLELAKELIRRNQ